MITLLAALAELYAVDPAPGAVTTFVSRGSNRWPAGSSVTTSTIAGHRDMSMTTCPGDAAYPLVKETFSVEVTAVLAARRPLAAPGPGQRPTTRDTAAGGTSGEDDSGGDFRWSCRRKGEGPGRRRGPHYGSPDRERRRRRGRARRRPVRMIPGGSGETSELER